MAAPALAGGNPVEAIEAKPRLGSQEGRSVEAEVLFLLRLPFVTTAPSIGPPIAHQVRLTPEPARRNPALHLLTIGCDRSDWRVLKGRVGPRDRLPGFVGPMRCHLGRGNEAGRGASEGPMA